MRFRISSIGVLAVLVLTILAWSPTFTNGLVLAQTINKTSVQVRLQVHKGFKGDPETWSWTPVINFRVEEAGVGWLGVRDCGQNPPEDQAVTYTGPVDLKINFRNELEGKSAT